MNHFLSPYSPDLFVVYSCLFLFGIASVIVIGIYCMRKKEKPQLSETRVDVVETMAWGIAVEMRRAKDEDELIKTLGSIKKYEIEFDGNVNAIDEIKKLKELYALMLDKLCSNAETIFSLGYK